MTLSDFKTSLSPLALALPFLRRLSVSPLQGPHRRMVCVRIVRAGWPACCEKWRVTAALFSGIGHNACGQCKTGSPGEQKGDKSRKKSFGMSTAALAPTGAAALNPC
ncbi:hypothetical protein Baya_1589 [Bagarius yarrelli]|uniref:Uncharacterized protein n=1 Tax=Bagarius yarrelli TaxID=175774 RepID=A0A556TLI2_BAGYA|nr:hypothetical protein Baya_1589 [Bagarius yarrelli]